MPVAAGAVLPAALGFPAPENKPPPLPPVAPVPEAKGLGPEAAGFGKPNGPENRQKERLCP